MRRLKIEIVTPGDLPDPWADDAGESPYRSYPRGRPLLADEEVHDAAWGRYEGDRTASQVIREHYRKKENKHGKD